MKKRNLLKSLNNYFNSNDSSFSFEKINQIKFLASFPEPINCIERSYFQYKCQKFLEKSYRVVLKEFIAIFGLVPFVLFLYFKKRKRPSKLLNSNIGVILFAGVDGIVPKKLQQIFERIETIPFDKEYFITNKDISFIIHLIKQYFFSPYFVIKSSYKIALYRAIINRFNPNSIICSSEYSFTSSLLTAYCELNEVKHINVMHGEKLFNIRDSFFYFHQCYVWDTHYVELLISLRAEPTQFIVARPPSLMIDNVNVITPIYEFTYYLGGESVKELQLIKLIMLSTKVNSKQLCVRFHPRESNKKEVSCIFKEFSIEDPEKCSINKSFCLTKRIVSLYSTVLYQGFLIGKEVIIDDITQKEKYNKLAQLKYIMINKPHKNLSDIIKKIELT